MATLGERFFAKVILTDGCWEWTGAKNWGYGAFWDGERVLGAHRVGYELQAQP